MFTEHLGTKYLDTLKSSVFCLNPVGFGWAVRLVTAAVHGCIPVTLQVGTQTMASRCLYWCIVADAAHWHLADADGPKICTARRVFATPCTCHGSLHHRTAVGCVCTAVLRHMHCILRQSTVATHTVGP